MLSDLARTAFVNAGGYDDAAEQIAAIEYAEGIEKLAAQDWDGARAAFGKAGDYSDAKERIAAVWYDEAVSMQKASDWNGARAAFAKAGAYSDAAEQIRATWYMEAESKQAAQDWEGAVEAYQAAGAYNNADAKIEECRYQRAVSLLDKQEDNDFSGAIEALKEIRDAELFEKAKAVFKTKNAFHGMWTAEFENGRAIRLGSYEQDNDPDNGPEPVMWKVLYAVGGEALLMSEKVIDAMPYMKDTVRTEIDSLSEDQAWKQSEIFRWANETFVNCFTPEEKALFIDSETSEAISILDNRGYKTYCDGEDSASVEATAYALSKDGTYHDLLNHYQQTHGSSVLCWLKNATIKGDKYLYPDDLDTIAGVRPVLLISYDKGPTDAWINERFAFTPAAEKE